MKIAFIGGVKFSYELLKHILENGWSVSVVFSYDNSKKKFYSDFISFSDLTKKYGINHIKVNNINDEENISLLRNIKPDLILVMGWSQLLKKEIIEIPKFGVIGSHPTELPKYRGRSPIPWSVLKGLDESALTFFLIEEGVDNGDIVAQRKFKITSEDDATSIYEKIISVGKEMLLETLALIEKGQVKRFKQNPEKFIENWPKRTPEDGKIDWSKSGKEIHTLIRATTYPYPGAFTFFKESKLIIWKALYSNEKSDGVGKIMDISKEGLKVGTGKGVVILQIVNQNGNIQVESSKIFPRDNIGSILG